MTLKTKSDVKKKCIRGNYSGRFSALFFPTKNGRIQKNNNAGMSRKLIKCFKVLLIVLVSTIHYFVSVICPQNVAFTL